jgi:hypothetical protein
MGNPWLADDIAGAGIEHSAMPAFFAPLRLLVLIWPAILSLTR